MKPMVLSILMALAASASAAAPAQVCVPIEGGVVVDYDGQASAYVLTRQGKPVPISFYQEIMGGDRLRLVRSGAVSIQIADGKIEAHTSAGTTYCVKAAARVTWINNLAAMIGGQLTAVREGVGALITRGEDLVLAPTRLASGTARVAAGERPFAVAWHGGEGPFSAELLGPGGINLVAQENLRSRLLIMRKPVALAPGRYVLRIRDARGTLAEGRFEAIAAPGEPQPRTQAEAMAAAGALLAKGPDRAYDAFIVLSPFWAEGRSTEQLMTLIAAKQ